MTLLKTESEIEILRISGKILARLLKTLAQHAQEGVNLLELDKEARAIAKKEGAIPIFLGYQPDGADHPFPAAICTSLNDEVVHGTPRDYVLKKGDILKIDAGVSYEGLCTDAAVTVAIGATRPIARKLMASTRRALEEAIAVAYPGNRLGDIGYAIEKRAKKDGFYVLRELTGHGVGYELHEDPVIFNYGKRGTGEILKPGMVLAIEPMLSISSDRIVQNDDESYSSADGSTTAHFEHTIVITQEGNEILTV